MMDETVLHFYPILTFCAVRDTLFVVSEVGMGGGSVVVKLSLVRWIIPRHFDGFRVERDCSIKAARLVCVVGLSLGRAK